MNPRFRQLKIEISFDCALYQRIKLWVFEYQPPLIETGLAGAGVFVRGRFAPSGLHRNLWLPIVWTDRAAPEDAKDGQQRPCNRWRLEPIRHSRSAAVRETTVFLWAIVVQRYLPRLRSSTRPIRSPPSVQVSFLRSTRSTTSLFRWPGSARAC